MEKYILKNTTQLRVRYGETDQMGYCYYGNYAQYFEVGRVEAMRELGMPYRTLEESGVMLPVSSFEVKYKYPAKYDDLLTITTYIVGVEGTRITFDYTIHNEDNKLVASAKTILVFVNKSTMRPMAPPPSFLSIIESH
jgi:acyl-CoA thioester hydrolase